MDGAEKMEEGLLGQVLSQLPVSQQTGGQAVDSLVVPLEQGGQGGDILTKIIANEIQVRGSLGNSCHYPLYRPDSAKSVIDVKSTRRVAGRIIAPVLALVARLSDAISNFVTRPRSFRRSSAI